MVEQMENWCVVPPRGEKILRKLDDFYPPMDGYRCHKMPLENELL